MQYSWTEEGIHPVCLWSVYGRPKSNQETRNEQRLLYFAIFSAQNHDGKSLDIS